MSNLKTGWLAPDGSFFECNSYDHNDEAKHIIKKIGYECPNNHYDDFLMEKGWVYIGISVFLNREWRVGWNKFLTYPQKQFLKPYFEDNIPMVCYAQCKWEQEMEC